MVDQSTAIQDLLIEIGVEELPAGSALPMAEYFASEVHRLLQENDFNPASINVFSTPRRMAVKVAGVQGEQAERSVERRGPALAAAFDSEGNPSKALQGFARSCGVDASELQQIETDKGIWLGLQVTQAGQTLDAFLNANLAKVIKQMPMPKRMRWAGGQEEFLRPVLWLLALHGTELLPLRLLGLEAGRTTRGHRFHTEGELIVDSAESYAQLLTEKGYVMPAYAERRARLVEQVLACAKTAKAEVVMDDALVDEVTSLVEWPVAVAGSFDEHFLELPKEALIQTMEENQRYFALLDANGDLKPGFITVANLESKAPDKVREGNERVIRPRFEDTMFFWNNDNKNTLESYHPALQKVLFQEKLGSVLDKTNRLETLAGFLAKALNLNSADCVRAAHLSKCDLLTEIVNELPKMQGIAGRYYAQRCAEPAEVSSALQEQYLPLKAGGDLPKTAAGQVLSIADKTDTLIGIFGIGQRPTGAKDPFALRRSSVGLLRIIIECGLELDLVDLFEASKHSFDGKLEADFEVSEVVDYALERLRSYYQDRGVSGDVVDSVMAKRITSPLDFDRRVKAIEKFRETDAAAALAAANKRIRNILKKSALPDSAVVDAAKLLEPAEKALAADVDGISAQLNAQLQQGDYMEVMNSTATLRPSVDAFFDGVMVMVDDEALRNNRLALLKSVGDLCSQTADLSRLQAGES